MNQHSQQDNGNEEPYVFTSVRFDPVLMKCAQNTLASCHTPCPVYLLEHQFTRMSIAKWSIFRNVSQDSKLNGACSSASNLLRGILSSVRSWHESHRSENPESLRIRIRVYESGRITTEMWPIQRVPLVQLFPNSLDLPSNAAAVAPMTAVLDLQATEPTDSTMFKTADRSQYGRARAGASIFSLAALKEVLLYNTDNNVLDGSQATPYFFRDGRWVTPSSASGGQQGTTRRWALHVGLCEETEVLTESLRDGEVIWLSNAVHGFRLAVFRTRQGEVQLPDADECQRISRQLR